MPCFILILPSGATNLFTLSTCRCCSVAKMCPTLCGLMESSLPSSSVHGISQAQILEWVAVSSSRGIFPDPEIKPVTPTLQAYSLLLSHQGSPLPTWQMVQVLKLIIAYPLSLPFPRLITTSLFYQSSWALASRLCYFDNDTLYALLLLMSSCRELSYLRPMPPDTI